MLRGQGGAEPGRIAMKANDLKKVPAAKRMPAKRAAVRFGRPPKELAGEVEASIDEIAEVARSGKPTIYGRFRDKGALFTAVMRRDILSRISQFKAEAPTGATVEERLTSAATTLMHWGLDGDRIALMRLAIAEARRFPDLASTVSRTARDLSTELGVHLLGEVTRSDELASLPAFTPERLAITARLFLDLVAVPMLLRALFEVDLKVLDAEVDVHVARGVAFFLAACRHGAAS
jgi:AcrR family transcriptional regulator